MVLVAVTCACAPDAGAQDPGDLNPPRITEVPVVTGTPAVGAVLTATPGSWRPVGATAVYGWLRCPPDGPCSEIPDAVALDHTVTSADAGYALTVRLVVTNRQGTSTTAESQRTPVVPVPAEPPVPTVTPEPTSTPDPTVTPAPTATPVPPADQGAGGDGAPATAGISAAPAILVPVVPFAAPVLLARMTPAPVVRIAGRFEGSRTTFTVFSVSAPRGARIAVSCRGPGCPYVRRAVAARLVRFPTLQRTFRAGAVIEVRVTAPGVIGGYTRIRIRRGRRPARVDRCLAPGASRPTPCPPA